MRLFPLQAMLVTTVERQLMLKMEKLAQEDVEAEYIMANGDLMEGKA
jgi:hypothetical protein